MADTPEQYRPENQLANANRDTLNISQPGETSFDWSAVRKDRESAGRKSVAADPSINLKDVGLSAASAPLELVRGGAEVLKGGNQILDRKNQQQAADNPNPFGISDQMMQVIRDNPGNTVSNALNAGAQKIGDAAGRASDAITENYSEGAKQAAAMPFVDRDKDGNLQVGAGAFDKDAWMIQAIPTVTQLLTTGAFSALTGRAAINAVESSVYKKLSQTLPEEVARQTARETAEAAGARAGKTAFVGANTVSAQGGAAVDMRNQINDLSPQELMNSPSFQQAFSQIDDDPQYQNLTDSQKLTMARSQLADQAANAITTDPKLLAVNLAATTLGDHTLLNLITRKGATTGIAAGIATGAAAEGGTEFVQGATQRYSQNQQLIDAAGQKIDPLQGVVETGASNAVLGAGIGGAAGAIGGVRARRSGEADPQAEGQPDTQADAQPDAGGAAPDTTSTADTAPAPDAGAATSPQSANPLGASAAQPDSFRDTPAYLRNNPRITGFAEDSDAQRALGEGNASPTADELIRQQMQGGDQGLTPDEIRTLEEADRIRQERMPRLPAPGRTSTIAMDGPIGAAPNPDESQAGSGPQFRGGEQVRGQRVLPAERQPRNDVGRASRTFEGETVPGNAIEDKNIIFAGGDQSSLDDTQAGRAPQFTRGETAGQRGVREFDENNPTDNRLPDARRRIGGVAEPDAVSRTARGEVPARLQFMTSGRPFSTERSASASKWAKEPGAQVEAVDGGYAVRIPQNEPAYRKGVEPDDSVSVVGDEGLTVLHGSNNPDLNQNSVEIIRATGQKQGKRGRIYGGFYNTHEEFANQAQQYANMMGGEASVYNVNIKPGTKVFRKSGDITRLTDTQINDYLQKGYGAIEGKDPRGQTEFVVIDKNAISNIAKRGQNAETSTLSDERNARAEVPAIAEQNQQSGVSPDEGMAEAPAGERRADAATRAESRSGDDLVPVRDAANAEPALAVGQRFTAEKAYGRWPKGEYRIESIHSPSGDLRLRDQNDNVYITNQRGLRTRLERGIVRPVADENAQIIERARQAREQNPARRDPRDIGAEMDEISRNALIRAMERGWKEEPGYPSRNDAAMMNMTPQELQRFADLRLEAQEAAATPSEAAARVRQRIQERNNRRNNADEKFSRTGANLRGGFRMAPDSFSGDAEPALRRGMSKSSVESVAKQFVRDLNGAAKVDVQVVGSQQEAAALVPGGIPQEYGTVHAMYQPRDRRVVLVAGNLSSAADVRAKLRHEILAHHGMETVIGADQYQGVMRAIAQTRGSNNPEIRRAWETVRREYAGESPETQAHEFLAHMAEADTSTGLGAAWDRLVGRITSALRAVGLLRSNETSPAEIRNLLRSIATAFRNGPDTTPPRGTRQSDTMLSQTGDVKGELRELRDNLMQNHGLEKLNVTTGNGVLDLNLIVAGEKGRGNGTKAIQELMDFADRKGLTMALTPSADFGGSKSRLTDYYKRLGFVENKGRNKDYEISESMYRPRLRYSRSAAQEIQQDINRKMGFNPETGRTDRAKSFFEKIKATDKAARKAWLEKTGRALNTRTFDGLAPIKYAEDAVGGINAQNSAYIGARMAAGSGSVTSATMEYGLPKYNKAGGVVERLQGTGKEDSLIGILDSLGNKREDFLKWIAGNRSEQLMAEGRENLFTAEEIQAMKALRNGNEELFDAAKKKYDAFTRAILDFQVDTGLLSKEMRDQWADAWYIPYYRQVDEESGQVAGPWTTKGIANQRSPAKKLKGGEANINDPIENLFNYTAKALDAGMKNEAMRRAVANLGDTDMMERIDSPNKFDYEAIGKDVVKVNIDGEENLVRIHDPELYRAFTMIDLQRSDAAFMKAARQAKRLLTIGTTSMPDFIIRNFMRDSLHSWAINKDGFKPIVDSWNGLKKGLKTDPTLIDMMFAGATFGGGYSNVYDPQGTARTIRGVLRKKGYKDSQIREFESTIVKNGREALSKIGAGLDKYRHVSESAENANRIATYEAAIRSGKSPAEAAFMSRDLMDFSMQGASKLVINLSDMLPFFNARLQGLSKLGRALKEDPREVTKRSAYIAGASLALLALNWDNDRYEELPDWDKDTYWHAWIGDQHIRIPKPFEIGLLFGTLPERAVRLMAGRDSGAKFGKLVAQEFANTMAFTPIPQVALPIAETYVNYNFFTGNPIENMSDANLIAKARYDDRTSMIAREIGELTGMSPKQIDHVVQGYTGSLGGYIMGASDFILKRTGDAAVPSSRVDELPLIKSFFRGSDPAKSTHFSEDFYKMMKEASEIYSTVRDYRKQGRVEDANELAQENQGKLAARQTLNHTQTQVRRLNQQIEMIKASKTLTPDQKRERIDRAFEQRNKLVQMVVQRIRPDFDLARD